ncbi:MAG: phenylalanine--tRNA ligase subunit beta [Patescibacteria group bacterium]|jgi:phenylalanyl-tRNA synthetase beta chain
MFVSLDWLKDFINIPKNITPEKLGEILTLHTVEVEEVKNSGENLDKIAVGKLIKIEKHPNADKLKLATVDLGTEEKGVVCGGSNLREGMLVAFAKIGAKIKWHGQGDLMELTPAIIRGEKSEGMICASGEIGLESLFPANDEGGVVDLPQNCKVGESLAKALKLNDVIYDIDNKSMTHRPDLWSHYGIARDLAAILNLKLKKYNTNVRELDTNIHELKNQINVKIRDSKLCPRYMAVSIEGIKIKPSPEKMQKRLATCGMRPINNIVDITNYVMLELGQPTHAFDAKKLGTKIGVRTAKPGEKLITLDKEERKLDDEMLLITDGENPIAIAGVMGGGNSEIDDNTTSIILEAANFDAVSIRKTSQKLGLRTDASQRFEKSLDPNLCELAINRIVELIKDSCPKAKINAVTDAWESGIRNQESSKPIKLDLEWANQKIGTEISKQKAVDILERLGFEVSGSKILSVKVPSWRATKDISTPEDLVEEIARIYGYGSIKPAMPLAAMQAPKINEELEFVNKIKDILSAAGMSEVYNYPFVNEKQLNELKVESQKFIKLANPLTADCTLLRQSLLPNILQNVITNQRNYDEIKLFEIGSVFMSEEGNLSKGTGKGNLPDQPKKIGLAYAGGNKSNFYKLKGVVENLAARLGIIFNFKIEEFDKNSSKQAGVKTEVSFCELDIRELLQAYKKAGVKKYAAKNKFPYLIRDMAFVVDEKILYNDIKKEILAADGMVEEVEVFDVYRGEKLGPGKKNLAMHVTFGSAEKTLTGEEVDKVQDRIVKALKDEFSATLRNF